MKKSKKGYTLVEMLLVVAIIIVLAGVAVYGISDMLNETKNKANSMQGHGDNFEPAASQMVENLKNLPVPPTPEPGIETTTEETTTTTTTTSSETTTAMPEAGGGGTTQATVNATGSTSGANVWNGGRGGLVNVSVSGIPDNAQSVTVVLTVSSGTFSKVSNNGYDASVSGNTATITLSRNDWRFSSMCGNGGLQFMLEGSSMSSSFSVSSVTYTT